MLQNIYLPFFLLIFCCSFSFCGAQEKRLYKEVDTSKLYLEVIKPEGNSSESTYPAIVFFFGGGWNGGDLKQFEPQATYFAKRGMVAILVDYRVRDRQKTTPFEALKDAKSAIRYIRMHAKELHINPLKIVASGGSAGGHLAAATAVINNYNEITDDLSINCIPNALVLFNPVIDNGPGGYGFERIGEAYTNFSPLHNIRAGTPPTIIFLGTEDKLIPVSTGTKYKSEMEKFGNRCDLKLYEGAGHGFFNHKNIENYKKTVEEADTFLQSIGFLKKYPTVTID
jgi:acetyl esterase/lipase